jgi:ABC-2 type transport system ATP-binding protein
VRNIQGVDQVDTRGAELIISVNNGAESIGNVAIALNQSGVTIREITLRTPTLDDVFLQVTGQRMQIEDTPDEVAA